MAEDAEGCTKFTVSLGVMLKLFQLMEALLVDWLMVVVVPLWLMFAEPVMTCPPVGEAKASVLPATSAETTREIFPPFRIRKRELKSELYFIVCPLYYKIL